jgi:hypothetical protein
MGIQFNLDIIGMDGKTYISMDSVLEVLKGIQHTELTEEQINEHFKTEEERIQAKRINHITKCCNCVLDEAADVLTHGGFSY